MREEKNTRRDSGRRKDLGKEKVQVPVVVRSLADAPESVWIVFGGPALSAVIILIVLLRKVSSRLMSTDSTQYAEG
jgi:hypothetical protein